MRDIKFRCWFASKMFYGIPKIYFNSDGVRKVDLNHNDNDFNNDPDTWTGRDDFELMQYTGLKDKNGKEIYEGDLIAEVDKIEDLKKWGTPLTVCFGEYVGDTDSWGIPDVTTGFFLRYNGNSDGQTIGIHNRENGYGFEAREIMVVGNIYENPNLLTDAL